MRFSASRRPDPARWRSNRGKAGASPTQADGAVFEIGRVTIWEPGARLGLTWRQASFTGEQSTHVDIRFEQVGTETRVTVEHHGWDAVPTAHVARHGMGNVLFLQRHGQWWRDMLTELKAEVEA